MHFPAPVAWLGQAGGKQTKNTRDRSTACADHLPSRMPMSSGFPHYDFYCTSKMHARGNYWI